VTNSELILTGFCVTGWIAALFCGIGWRFNVDLVKKLFRAWDDSISLNRQMNQEIVRSQQAIRDIIRLLQDEEGDDSEKWKNN
jgi:hypothetical protein